MTHENTHERPLVTFALFAFNQEKYIREAIEGAFAQTYEPLEIIISDDGSSDKTFEIMVEMASEYVGPHKIIVRKSEINLGTALHVQAVFEKSKGNIIVVASGDDVSKSNRTEEIVKLWCGSSEDVSCIHSGAAFFYDNSELHSTVPPREPNIVSLDDRVEFLFLDKLPFLSPTCAYSRGVFANFEPLVGGSIIEDGVMGMRSLASGAVLSIDEPLVLIRKQDETSGTGYSIKNPVRWNRFVRSRLISYSNRLRDISMAKLDDKVISQLETIYQKKIFIISRFFVNSSTEMSILIKIKFLFFYVLKYPTAAPFLIRVADAAKISCLSSTFVYRFCYFLVKGRKS